MSYSTEQEQFLDEIYVEELPEFGEPELCLTVGDKMIRGEDDDISFGEVLAGIEYEDFVLENGREPNYKEMSQGW